MANENIMILKTKYGEVEIELYADKAPNHVKRFKDLADSGKYDGVVFHRVIDGFMAQTGDVKFGNTKSPNFNLALADPNSANSQFFICFESAPHLDRQYSAFGKVVKGMEYIDKIKKGDPNTGSVAEPDIIISLKSK